MAIQKSFFMRWAALCACAWIVVSHQFCAKPHTHTRDPNKSRRECIISLHIHSNAGPRHTYSFERKFHICRSTLCQVTCWWALCMGGFLKQSFNGFGKSKPYTLEITFHSFWFQKSFELLDRFPLVLLMFIVKVEHVFPRWGGRCCRYCRLSHEIANQNINRCCAFTMLSLRPIAKKSIPWHWPRPFRTTRTVHHLQLFLFVEK